MALAATEAESAFLANPATSANDAVASGLSSVARAATEAESAESAVIPVNPEPSPSKEPVNEPVNGPVRDPEIIKVPVKASILFTFKVLIPINIYYFIFLKILNF